MAVKVLELRGVLAALILGQLVERHAHDRLAAQMGGAKQSGDRIDGTLSVVGFHNQIKHFVAPFEGARECVGNLAAGSKAVVVGHGASLRPVGRRRSRNVEHKG
ncbi:Uncharacterised protein [Mycobacteroides abscessus subsp. abscessus]|nr:Uncharacterised protein [Mycobacteroides abscessus subsp. abscessus]